MIQASDKGMREERDSRIGSGHPSRWLAGASAAAVLVLQLAALPATADPGPERGESAGDGKKESESQEGRGDRSRESGRSRDGDDRDRSPWSWMRDTSPEQREKIKAALKQVWEDQEVQAAREHMKSATAAYKDVLREAIAKTDPEVRSIIDRIMRDRLWHELTRDDVGRRGPDWMRSIPEELQERFRKTFAEIDEDAEVQALKQAFFDAPREEKGSAWEALGKKIHQLVEAKDPELLPYLPKPPAPGERSRSDRRRDGDPEQRPESAPSAEQGTDSDAPEA